MRARLGVQAAGLPVEYREVVLRDKPAHMVAISPKATVPVLQLPDGRVIDESLDIMLWALGRNDPLGLIPNDPALLRAMKAEIEETERVFKPHLDGFKYPDRHEGGNPLAHREAGLAFLARWDGRLSVARHLFADRPLLADLALFPFARQFAAVDRGWFEAASVPHLRRWLAEHTGSSFFAAIMEKLKPWKPGDPVLYFPFRIDTKINDNGA